MITKVDVAVVGTVVFAIPFWIGLLGLFFILACVDLYRHVRTQFAPKESRIAIRF